MKPNHITTTSQSLCLKLRMTAKTDFPCHLSPETRVRKFEIFSVVLTMNPTPTMSVHVQIVRRIYRDRAYAVIRLRQIAYCCTSQQELRNCWWAQGPCDREPIISGLTAKIVTLRAELAPSGKGLSIGSSRVAHPCYDGFENNSHFSKTDGWCFLLLLLLFPRLIYNMAVTV